MGVEMDDGYRLGINLVEGAESGEGDAVVSAQGDEFWVRPREASR